MNGCHVAFRVKYSLVARRKSLLIFGTGGHAISVASLAEQCGYRIDGFISATDKPGELLGVPVILTRDLFRRVSFSVSIAVGDNSVREEIVKNLLVQSASAGVDIYFPNLIHPAANLGIGVELGQGNQLFPGISLASRSMIQDFVVMNHLSSLDHESVMSSFSSLGPGALTGGRVSLGFRSAALINSSISNEIKVGQDVILAANSFLKSNAPDNSLYGGSPAKLIRVRSKGDQYL